MNIRVHNQANEFRVEVDGFFADAAVVRVSALWESALRENNARRFTIDISQLTGFDNAGWALLHKMQAHGTHMVAGTPASLAFLREISSPLSLNRALLRAPSGQEDKSLPAKPTPAAPF